MLRDWHDDLSVLCCIYKQTWRLRLIAVCVDWFLGFALTILPTTSFHLRLQALCGHTTPCFGSNISTGSAGGERRHHPLSPAREHRGKSNPRCIRPRSAGRLDFRAASEESLGSRAGQNNSGHKGPDQHPKIILEQSTGLLNPLWPDPLRFGYSVRQTWKDWRIVFSLVFSCRSHIPRWIIDQHLLSLGVPRDLD